MPEGWTGAWPSAEELRGRIKTIHGISCGSPEVERLLVFLRLLERWAGRFNLISARTKEEVVERHLIDSLALVPLIEPARSIADLGSGAGFPGVPLAVMIPQALLTLIEPRRHRANFLRDACRRLSLANVGIDESSGGSGAGSMSFDVVTGRAIRFDILTEFAGRVLSENGRVLTMSKAATEVPVPEGYRLGRVVDYRLGDGERHRILELLRCFT